MKKQELAKSWTFEYCDSLTYGLQANAYETRLPASMVSVLYAEKEIPDPYNRDNELAILPLSNGSCEFRYTLVITAEMLESDFLALHFDGIDTLAEIYVNEVLVLETNNMHCTYECELHGAVTLGENSLRVKLLSPVKYIREMNEEVVCGGSKDSMAGFPHLRKSHCMFGWDWGPRIPDMGIYRPVSLLWGNQARLEDVVITQTHDNGLVALDFEVTLDVFCETECSCGQEVDYEMEAYVKAPDGTVYLQNEEGVTVIDTPELWWPNGYGEQPLYEVTVELTNAEGTLLDTWQRKIGLRTITVNREKNEWGENFAHEVNGQFIFAMGADYIPEDSILSRCTKERTRQLLEDAVLANHNCIRVWGGGYYPNDYFYEICDELGLIVWQDFMFACADYELTEEFEANITEEIIQNIKRLRHHACLGLWCGNNEMETQTLDRCYQPSQKQFCDYVKIFDYLIPKLVKEYDPNTFYWPSSPSSGGNYENPWAENIGDTHYWDVWHGEKPFTEYRKHYFSYLSEFGFQSFPCLLTVESFTAPEDRNIFSRVMEMHQRNQMANGKILRYLSDTFLYPKDFSSLLYASQLLQLEAIRYGVEHFRRYRGRCMGTIVWQLNDCWPVASWSSIDYYGRWKALHYGEKRMFEPVHISCEETGELTERPSCVSEPAPIRLAAKLHVANETREAKEGIVRWELREFSGKVVRSGQQEVVVPAMDGVWLDEEDFSEYDSREIYLSYEFLCEDEIRSAGTVLFTAPKHAKLQNPELSVTVKDELVTIRAKAYAKNVEVYATDGECLFSDNFFDMNPGERTICIVRGQGTDFAVRSVYDIG